VAHTHGNQPPRTLGPEKEKRAIASGVGRRRNANNAVSSAEAVLPSGKARLSSPSRTALWATRACKGQRGEKELSSNEHTAATVGKT